MEKRVISSGATLFWKKAFPAVWITFMAFGGAATLWRVREAPVFVVLWLAAAAAGSAYLLWFASRLKVVSLDSQFLYVDDGGREVAVPLGLITGVRETMLSHPKQVIVELGDSAWSARKIVFVPRRAHGLNALSSDPIVDELRLHIAPEAPRGRGREHLGYKHRRRP